GEEIADVCLEPGIGHRADAAPQAERIDVELHLRRAGDVADPVAVGVQGGEKHRRALDQEPDRHGVRPSALPPPGRDAERPAVLHRGEPGTEIGRHAGYLLTLEMNLSIGMAASVVILMLPRAASSAETRAMVSLSGASTTERKSYGPRRAYWLCTFTPSFSISLLTSRMRVGFLVIVPAPSSVSELSNT